MKSKQELTTLFKNFQNDVKHKDTYENGIKSLMKLRLELKDIYKYIFDTCDKEDFSKMPLSNDKTIAYYIYHLNRIEDITSNTLILDKQQVFFKHNFDKLLNSPIQTTGNELKREKLCDFSKKLDIEELQKYNDLVFDNTNELIKQMTFDESKSKVSEERKNNLISLNVVSTDENAFWLIDYWCKKTYAGLALMPFSRHQMMHLDGCQRIMKKLKLI